MERTVTFTMEDALISPEGFMILSGAGLIDATADKPIYQHVFETVSDFTVDSGKLYIHLEKNLPYMPKRQGDNFAYVMLKKGDEIVSEPFIPVHAPKDFSVTEAEDEEVTMPTTAAPITADPKGGYWIMVEATTDFNNHNKEGAEEAGAYALDPATFDKYDFNSVLVDYYVKKESNAQQINITADKFGGNYYLEGSTLWRDINGVDSPAEFIIPNCRVQSNFTFTMASSGDPSSFTFTLDAFPDYTRFDPTEKVMSAIQIIHEAGAQDLYRDQTAHNPDHDLEF